ncbi:hypothetical protein OJAV_G00186390 [Oryzias javanicus]|uniref:Uncharacterized protein n=1 Tax=Oryzias javanicus TaxID=123683 RepID=A0A437C913_ORYJA|nr:hypothetical protein OJAV_G00186390 [Oryzias javanicus]
MVARERGGARGRGFLTTFCVAAWRSSLWRAADDFSLSRGRSGPTPHRSVPAVTPRLPSRQPHRARARLRGMREPASVC